MTTTLTKGGTSKDVQGAVDDESGPTSAGVVILKGTFDFSGGTVKVNPQHSILIAGDPNEAVKPVIMGGGGLDSKNVPFPAFDIIAPNHYVTIQNLHFLSPQLFAIRVQKVGDLVIADCNIEKVQPMTVTQSGETFSTAGGIVIGSEATGVLSIRDNEIDFGEVSPFRTSGIAISPHRTLGIAIIKAGPTELNITGNKVRHVTAAGIDCRNNTVSRLATIELNEIAMGVVGVSKSSFLVSGIRCSGSIDNSGNSEYRVLNNTISCGFEKSAGIRLISNSNSYVQGNKISLSMHDYAVADRLSAGIEIRGNSTGNKIVDNTVSGRAYAALSVIKAKTQVLLNFSPQTEFQDLKPPDGTIFWGNHQMNFIPQLADIHVGVDVENTWLVAPVEGLAGTTVGLAGTVADLGKGTIIIGDFWPAP